MSISQMTEVYKRSLKRHHRDLLLVLADTADDDGYLVHRTISRSLIAYKLDISKRQVSRTISELVELGLIERLGGGAGKQRSSYRLHLDRAPMRPTYKEWLRGEAHDTPDSDRGEAHDTSGGEVQGHGGEAHDTSGGEAHFPQSTPMSTSNGTSMSTPIMQDSPPYRIALAFYRLFERKELLAEQHLSDKAGTLESWAEELDKMVRLRKNVTYERLILLGRWLEEEGNWWISTGNLRTVMKLDKRSSSQPEFRTYEIMFQQMNRARGKDTITDVLDEAFNG